MNGFSLIQFFCSARRRALLALLGISIATSSAWAEDILVTTAADSGPGSLREAFTTAADGDRIVFEIPGTPEIQLLSDLPDVAVDLSFANNNPTDVTINRNGNGPLSFSGAQVDPTILVVNTGGAASPDADIVGAAATTFFGDGPVSGNLQIPGTLSPGTTPDAGSIGTFSVTGDVDLSTGQLQSDLTTAAGTPTSDLVEVAGILTVTDAVLAPRFIGGDFETGQQFLLVDSTDPLVGTFINQDDAFALPNNPFLQAVRDLGLGADDFGLVLEDNGLLFTEVVSGCNQSSAARLLDQAFTSPTPPDAILALRNGSTDDVLMAVNQRSGSIYPSLIGAEINHVQTGLDSVRNMIVRQAVCCRRGLTPWARGFGTTSEVEMDDCQTTGYRHETGGVELGSGFGLGCGVATSVFSHLAFGTLNSLGVDQRADINSYRLGGSLAYSTRGLYWLAAGGGGYQDYSVRRSLTAFEGSSFVESDFDGSSQFGYFEVGSVRDFSPYLGMHVTRVDLDPIAETGDDDLALTNNGGSGDSLRSILGIACYKSNCTSFGIATTRLRFGWLHEYLDESEVFVSQIAATSDPANVLTDRGVSAGRDWAFARMQVDTGMVMGGYLTFAYEGHFNSDSAFNWFLAGWMY